MLALGIFFTLAPNSSVKHESNVLKLNANHQVLAYETSSPSDAAGWGSSRFLFAETDSGEGGESGTRRFVALDFRGGAAGGEVAQTSKKPGWALGVGHDGNGALGLGQPAELSR